jgi:hypothetical protein
MCSLQNERKTSLMFIDQFLKIGSNIIICSNPSFHLLENWGFSFFLKKKQP